VARDTTPDVTVVGAGVAGLCVATELVARGIPLRLLDTAGEPGAHGCSWWAGGMLAPFCEAESAEEPVVRLGQEAAGWWARHADCVASEGSLVVTLARDRRELERFARRTAGHRRVAQDEIGLLEPALEGRVRDALFFEQEAHLDPRAALMALRDGLARRGIPIERRSFDATGVGPDDRVPAGLVPRGLIIDCRGFAARDQLPDLRGVKGEMVVLRSPDLVLRRPVRLLHPRHPLYIVPRGDGVFMLGATQIESGERSRVSVRSLMELLSAAFALHPAFGEAEVLEMAADVRPAFPDNLPRIRRQGGRIYVNGLFRHGFLLAPAVATQLADWITTGKKPEVMDENDDAN